MFMHILLGNCTDYFQKAIICEHYGTECSTHYEHVYMYTQIGLTITLCFSTLFQSEESANLVIKVNRPHEWLLIPTPHTGAEV